MPVRETPSNLSSSALCFQIGRTYLKFVSVDWYVPIIVAIRTLSLRLASVSVLLTITSERLHNPALRRMISQHGFVPKSCPSTSLRPVEEALLVADTRLNTPRSPLLLAYKDFHSSMKIPMSGFSV